MIRFTEQECDDIISLSNTLKETIRDGENADVDRPRKNISYSFYTIERNSETQWIFDRLTDYLEKVDNIKVIKDLDVLHLHKYNEGNEFIKHRDVYYPDQARNIGICLNDNYEGGDFIVYEPKEILPKQKGSIYSFKNTRLHEVTKITKGVRWAIIGFLLYENLDIKPASI
jgi:hypothetical protein